MAACTFDLTLDEAWQHWRQEAHAERQRAEQAEEALADKRGGLQRAVEEWRDKYDREAASAAYATDRAERAAQREARLRAALEEARAYIEAPCDPIATRLIGRIDAALAPEQEAQHGE